MGFFYEPKQERMNNKMTYIVIVILTIIIALSGCTSDSDYIQNRRWKGGNGDDLPDWMDFTNNTWQLSNDTIFLDTAIAVVISLDKRPLVGDRVLRVKSLKKGEEVFYNEK